MAHNTKRKIFTAANIYKGNIPEVKNGTFKNKIATLITTQYILNVKLMLFENIYST